MPVPTATQQKKLQNYLFAVPAVKPTTPVKKTTTPAAVVKKENKDDDIKDWHIIVIVLGSALLIAAIFAAVWFYKRRQAAAKEAKVGVDTPTVIEALPQETALGTEMGEVPSADQQKAKDDDEAVRHIDLIPTGTVSDADAAKAGHNRTASNLSLMGADKSTLE